MMIAKIWCLHCETVTLGENLDQCNNCGAGPWDIENLSESNIAGEMGPSGFFFQAYPEMQYDKIEVGKKYPLYPDKEVV